MPSDIFEIVVIGAHPSAGVAALVAAREREKVKLLHIMPPGESHGDRLVATNPKFADLHPALSKLKRLAGLHAVHGLTFLPDTAGGRGEFVSKSPAMLVGSFATISRSVADLEREARIDRVAPRATRIERVVDDGVAMTIDGRAIVARVVLCACDLAAEEKRLLGIASQWEPGVMHRYTHMRFKPGKGVLNLPANRTVPMSLDLAGSGAWAWLLDDGETAQLATLIAKNAAAGGRGEALMQRWIAQLAAHGIVAAPARLPAASSATMLELPIGGALSAETVANRTLLIGPAGGFYSACGEDIYPNCWSAVAAAKVAVAALGEPHVQDALQSYREGWGTTLGDYLRGPQQNLKLLLPLVYRNNVMAARVAEAILFGESVVR